jgi:hypothetical protein
MIVGKSKASCGAPINGNGGATASRTVVKKKDASFQIVAAE